jgi:tetratricopeptide (TPR) repeat protein/predicted Ser/Thr protein kinase
VDRASATGGDFDRESAEVDRLLDLPPSDRAGALDTLRARDPELAGRVARWLAGIERSEGFLERDAVRVGQAVGPWALQRRIGRGGMGEVWLATRADGRFERQVAIKFLRGDRIGDARSILREQRLLARLEHPDIARLLDAGEDPQAGVFLVTEFVDGRPLDRWLDEARPDLGRRLAVFERIADAVAHAHRLLVIHRDLKPGNILVDSSDRPVLLDFGIARLVEPDAAHAETVDVAGTPSYAAPEQLAGGPLGTRTDVYGLGGVLYRLLTDGDPLPLDGASLAEAVRRVCSESPVPPGRRSAVGELPRDLEAICLMALEKEPGLRYASVDALQADLRAFAAGEPVTARRGGRSYRALRFVGRHRYALALATVLVVIITGALAAVVVQARIAAREAARAGEVKTFLMGLFASIDPGVSKGEIVPAESLVAEGERRLADGTLRDPELKLELFGMLARMRLDLRQYAARLANQERACALTDQVHGPTSDAALVCAIELADSLRLAGRPDEAGARLDDAMAQLASARSPAPLREALALEVRFMIERDLDRRDAAEAAIRRSIELARRAEAGIGPQAAHSMEQYAVFLNAAGRLDEAEPLLADLVAYDRAHPDARARSEQLNTRWNLASYYWSRERFADVLAATSALGRDTEADLGRNHATWFRVQQLTANVHARLGRYGEAIAIRESADAVEGIGTWAGGAFRQMLRADQTIDLAAVGRTADSEALAHATLALTDDGGLAGAPAFTACTGALVAAALDGDRARTRAWFAELDRRYAALPASQREALRRHWLQSEALLLRVEGRHADAIQRLAEAVALTRPAAGSSHALERVEAVLGFAQFDAGRLAEAAVTLRSVHERLRARFGDGHPGVLQVGAVLAMLPDAASSASAQSNRDDAVAGFERIMGRAPDRLRLW